MSKANQSFSRQCDGVELTWLLGHCFWHHPYSGLNRSCKHKKKKRALQWSARHGRQCWCHPSSMIWWVQDVHVGVGTPGLRVLRPPQLRLQDFAWSHLAKLQKKEDKKTRLKNLKSLRNLKSQRTEIIKILNRQRHEPPHYHDDPACILSHTYQHFNACWSPPSLLQLLLTHIYMPPCWTAS